jgi:hypothetical protein
MPTLPSDAARGFTGAYDVDVFISYGHTDNLEN